LKMEEQEMMELEGMKELEAMGERGICLKS
jgi:hypothetical protein